MPTVYLPMVSKQSRQFGVEIWPGLLATLGRDLLELNVKVVRTYLRWSEIEIRKGVYSWGHDFNIDYEICKAQKIEMICSIHDTPWFYHSEIDSRFPPAPEHLPAAMAFVREAIEHYPAIKIWEWWNEPDASPGVNGYFGEWPDPAYYGQALGEFYRTVKAYPGKRVLFGSLIAPSDYYRIAMANGGLCDAVGVHVYQYLHEPFSQGREIIERYRETITDKPIWITETSAITHGQMPFTERYEAQQADWLAEVNGWPEAVKIWYGLGDTNWQNSGLYQGDTRKAAWYRMREVNLK